MEKILGLLALSLGKKFTVYAVGRVSVVSVNLQSRCNQTKLRIYCVRFVYYKKRFSTCSYLSIAVYLDFMKL